MKIRYLGETPTIPSQAHLLTGHEYIVLALITDLRTSTTSAIVLNDDLTSPVRVDASVFQVSNEAVPRSWEIAVTLDAVTMAPKGWDRETFWDEVFRGDSDAIEEFHRVLPALYQEITNSPYRRAGVQ